MYKKSVTFVHTSNEQSENGIKTTVPFAVASKVIKEKKLTKMCRTYTLTTIKHYWKRLKIYINGKTFCGYGLEGFVIGVSEEEEGETGA